MLALADALNQELLACEAAGADVLQVDEPGFHGGLPLARRVGTEALARMVRGVKVPVQVHVCYGYAHVFPDKTPSAHYAEALALIAASPVSGISLEYEQPGHEPDILACCRDKHVILGLLDLAKPKAETARHITRRLGDAMQVVPPTRLHPASDCGMWHLPRAVAFAKMAALAEGTALVRTTLGDPP